MSQKLPMTTKTRVRRQPDRSEYDVEAIYALLDDVPFATIAFSDGVDVHAIPTAIWRQEGYLYIHGSNASRLLNVLEQGASACVSVTRMDGMVLARSALHHSMNYSSVNIYGVFEWVDAATKNEHLRNFMEHWLPGRWQHVRSPDKNELSAVKIMRISIVEAVLKCRQGGPKDLAADMEQPVWAGIMPLKMQWQMPLPEKEQEQMNLPGQTLRPF